MIEPVKPITSRLSRLLSDKHYTQLYYFTRRKEFLRLNNPKTFSEKLQWIKIYGNLENYTEYVDKYLVRNYVRKVAGDKYLIPLLGHWKSFDEIDFRALPQQFVLKGTHGSGYNYVCNNKATLDKARLKAATDKWLNENYYQQTREAQYKSCKPRLVCEKYLEDKNGQLNDYKLFCFNGKVELIEVDADRFTDHKRDFYNISWERLPFTCTYPQSKHASLRPKTLPSMIELAQTLSKPFPFVRVDLYAVDSRVYFGELTFTPANGMAKFQPKSADLKLGALLNIAAYQTKPE